MGSVEIERGIIHYYGNRAGKVLEGKAVVDPIFKNTEMENFLKKKKIQTVEWREGVFEQLSAGKFSAAEEGMLKSCRIWQLKPEADVRKKFIGYDRLMKHFGALEPCEYAVVFDGEVETNDLEALYQKFCLSSPQGYQGHSISMSDIVELYDEKARSFYYVDRFGFREVDFSENNMQTEPVMKL